MKRFVAVTIFIGAVFTIMFLHTAQEYKHEQAIRESLPEIPVPGMVTFVNMGADSCLPCRMMQPFLEELKIQYQDQAKIAYVDVWKHTHYGQRFEIMTIPTQLFFDHNGREVFRHQGFMDKNSISAILEELLDKQNTASKVTAI